MDRFHPFLLDLKNSLIPKSLNNPFDYTPNELCIYAANVVKEYVGAGKEWKQEVLNGKMFGVLVVEYNGQLGFLAAFSGNLRGGDECGFFVPAVCDLQNKDGFYKKGEALISEVNEEIKILEHKVLCDAKIVEETELLKKLDKRLNECKLVYYSAKKEREKIRKDLDLWNNLSEEDKNNIIRESQFQKGEIRRAEKKILEQKGVIEKERSVYFNQIESLKEKRKKMSIALQDEIFKNYLLVNFKGERSDLLEIFKNTPQKYPPAGAGDCAGPKLLQYAFKNGLKPLCIAEFWYGASPKGEIRHHGNFYPACKGKCEPILGFMLKGMDVEKEEFHKGYGGRCGGEHCNEGRCGCSLKILFNDEFMVVVNKPEGMLSVPGRSENFSVLSLIKQMYPASDGPMIVHRLDMHTSGVMVIAKNEKVYKNLQKQFINRKVKKVYHAVLDGVVESESGSINLPLLQDYNNRPMQKVDYVNGKEAITEYKVLDVKNGKTFIEFYPVTGRTHQLRVHASYFDGLNAPIVGDILYGKQSSRLMLHCFSLEFRHPITGQMVYFEAKENLKKLNNF